MKIALLTEKYPPAVGGLAVSVERLAVQLVNTGHTVQVFTLDNESPPGQQIHCEREGVRILRLGTQRRVSDTLVNWSDTIIRHSTQFASPETPFDLFHGYFLPQAGFTAVYTARMLGLPGVVSARGNDLDRAVFDPGKAAHVFFALQHAAAITVNSQELARKVEVFSGRQAIVIPNGVDGQRFQPMPRRQELAVQLGLQGSVLGFAGEARAKKGLAFILLAFQELAANYPLSLLLVGGIRQGEDHELLKVFRKQHPELRIIETGHVPLAEMPDYYNLMDVVLMPSLHDGLPNSLLEAMACSRALVAGRSGGIPDALVDQVNGRLVEPGDVNELVRAVASLLDDPAERQRLGMAARQTVLDRFSLAQELEKTRQVYAALTHQ